VERAWRARGAHWVEPRLVGEVAFTEWTADASMRHPCWPGLRAGKNPGDVHREALSTPAARSKPARHAKIPAHFEPGRCVAAMTGAASGVLTTAASAFSPRTSRLLPWILVQHRVNP
jgi:ATP dependent DNA ligase C terminal region